MYRSLPRPSAPAPRQIPPLTPSPASLLPTRRRASSPRPSSPGVRATRDKRLANHLLFGSPGIRSYNAICNNEGMPTTYPFPVLILKKKKCIIVFILLLLPPRHQHLCLRHVVISVSPPPFSLFIRLSFSPYSCLNLILILSQKCARSQSLALFSIFSLSFLLFIFTLFHSASFASGNSTRGMF